MVPKKHCEIVDLNQKRKKKMKRNYTNENCMNGIKDKETI